MFSVQSESMKLTGSSIGLDLISPAEGQAVCHSFRVRGVLANHGMVLRWAGQQQQQHFRATVGFATKEEWYSSVFLPVQCENFIESGCFLFVY